MRIAHRLRACARVLVVASLLGGSLTHSPSLWAQSGNESALEAEALAGWQKSRDLTGAGKFAEALSLLTAQQSKLDAQLGPNHKLSQTNRQMLAIVQQTSGQASAPPPAFPAAAPPTLAAPSSGGKTFVRPEDMERSKAAVALGKEALTLVKAGRDAEAMPKLDQAVGVLEETLGPEQDLVKVYRELLLNLYRKNGKPELAAAVDARTARARANYKVPTGASPEVEATMQKLVRAMAAFSSHDFDTALKLFEEAGPHVESTVKSPESRANFTSIHASLCDYASQYDRAEGLHKKAIAEFEAARGADSLELAPYILSLVTHYLRRMEPQKALPHAARIVVLNRKHRPGSGELFDALRSLGDLKIVSGDVSGKAELREAAALVAALSPPDPARMLQLSESMAQAAELSGDRATAMKLKAAACDIASSSGDAALMEKSRTACIEAAWGQGQLGKAETLLQQSLETTSRKYNNPRSVLWEPISHNLAMVRYALGKKDEALTLATELEEITEKRMTRDLATGSDAQKRAVFTSYLTGMNDVLSMGADGSGGPKAVRLGLTTLLRRKGRSLDASADAVRAQRLLSTPEQRALLARQGELRGLMVGLVLRGSKDLDPAATSQAVTKLEAEEESVTKQLAQSSQQYRALTQPVTIEAVQQLLPADTALVEYVAVLLRDKNMYRPASKRYFAYVLRSTGEPVAFDLGDALPIGIAAERMRKVIRERGDASAPSRALDGLVIQPLRAQLSGIKRLVVSPDDDLNLVPFAALKDQSGKYLLEQYEVDYLTSGRDLLRLAATGSAHTPPVLLGNPSFDSGANAAPTQGTAGQRSGDLARARFSPLPGTDQEVQAINGVLSGSRLFTGSSASKSVLQGLDAPLVLHVATHGFFLDQQVQTAQNARGLELDLGDSSVPDKPQTDENPLIRSGLALSGANDKTTINGILTALEASNINLDGTRLVVLSACETAVGQVQMGQGVYGLRRALLVAGSQTQVMSLWKVDDNATRDLMIGFYKRLREGKGRGESLRQVQLEMLARKEYAHPYFWAAFIPSGSWEKMDFVVAPAGGASSGSSTASSDSSSSSSGPRDILTSDGMHFSLFVRRMSLENLLNQPDRAAWTLGLSIETNVLSGKKDGKTGFGFHDAAVFEVEAGLRTSEAWRYADATEEQNPFAYGYFVAYEAALGYRGHPFGLLAGVRPGLRGVTLGDARTFGGVVPFFGTLEMQTGDDDLFTVSGWYGEIVGGHASLGVRADMTFDDGFFRFQVSQDKLPTSLGGLNADDRLEIGRQVNTAYTVGIGGHL